VEAFLFYLVLFAVIVTICVAIGRGRNEQATQAFAQVAVRYGGNCEPAGLFSWPRVNFVYGCASVVVDVHSTGGENATHYTQVHFRGHLPQVRCEVYPDTPWTGLRKFLGMEDVEIGAPDFDSAYVIKGDSAENLRALLTPAVQATIQRLRGLLGNNDIYVSLNREQLLVKKRSFIRDAEYLLRYVELAVALYDEMLGAEEQGIEFIEAPTDFESAEAICQVCGEAIEDDVVYCRRCATPHHRDCWEYNGVCSTYGCQESRCDTHPRGARHRSSVATKY